MAEETIRQDERELAASRELSASEARQHPEAPKIPGYVLISPIGSGAYAQVWKAWQARTRKLVAVKVFTQREGVNWLFLQREVERLIRLDKHPSIVSLLDADLTGEPAYYVMDLMEGGSLARFVESGKTADPAAAARWMEDIAAALAYVHSKGLIHCDLKPANVLLDEQGRVRVADFGQSRILSESTGALGTLYYMAPEQALTFGQNELLYPDVRWDIYGLGSTLYAVLAGRAPHEAELKGEIDAHESLAQRLKAYRDGVRRARVPAPAAADEDLAAVVARCMEPWVERRYATAEEVSADLRARREGLPVRPLAARRGYRLRKFLARNKALVSVVLLAAAGLGWSLGLAVAKHRDLRGKLAFEYVLRAQQHARENDPLQALEFYRLSQKTRRSHLAEANVRAYERRLPSPRATLVHNAQVHFLGFGPDGRLWTQESGKDSSILVWDASVRGESVQPAARVRARPEGSDALEFFSEGGLETAKISDHESVVYELATGRSFRILPARYPYPRNSWTSMAYLRALRAHKLARKEPPVTLARDFPPQARLTPDYSYPEWQRLGPVGIPKAAAFGHDRILAGFYSYALLWDPATGRQAGPPLRHDGAVEGVALSPDGQLAATASRDGSARLWDARTGRPASGPLRHEEPVTGVFFSPDGRRLLTVSADKTARLWDVPSGRPLGAAMRHAGPVLAGAFSPDGRWVATGSEDRTARFWEARTGLPAGGVLAHAGAVTALAFSPDGTILATAGREEAARLWDVPAAEESRLLAEESFYHDAAYSPGGRFVALLSHSRIQVLDEGGKVVSESLDHVNGMRLSPDGRTWALEKRKGEKETLVLRDARTGEDLAEIHDGRFLVNLGFSPDGALLVTTSRNERVGFWDARTGKPAGPEIKLEKHNSPFCAAISPDRRLVALGLHKRVELRDLRSGALVGRPLPHEGLVLAVAFSPDGRTLLTSSGNAAFLWEVRAGRPLGKPLRHEGEARSVAFSPDGRTVLTGSEDKTARFWDARTGEPIGEPLRHQSMGLEDGKVQQAVFRPDQAAVLTLTNDGDARLWPVPWLAAAPREAPQEEAPRPGGLPDPGEPSLAGDWKAALEKAKKSLEAAEAAEAPQTPSE